MNLQTLTAQLKANPNVTTLDLANSNILSPLELDGTADVGKVLKGTKITTLSLKRTDIGLQGVLALLPELKHTSVTTLNLYGNKMFDGNNIDCLEVIEFVEALKDSKVATLDIGDNNIGAERAKVLIPLLKDTKVTTLGLGHNNVVTEGAKDLIPLLKDNKLTTLNLEHNEISEDTLQAISDILENNRKNTAKESTTEEGFILSSTEKDFTAIKEESTSENATVTEEATSISKIIVLAVSGLSFLLSVVGIYPAYNIYKKLFTKDENLATPKSSEIPLDTHNISDANDEYEPVGSGHYIDIVGVQALQGATAVPGNFGIDNGGKYEIPKTTTSNYMDMTEKLQGVTAVPNNLGIDNAGYEAAELSHYVNITRNPIGVTTNTPVYNNIPNTNNVDKHEVAKTAASHYVNIIEASQNDGNGYTIAKCKIDITTVPDYINFTKEPQGVIPLLGQYVNTVCESDDGIY